VPSQVRIISPKNSQQWGDLVRDVTDAGRWEEEIVYGGITSQERADKIRRALRTAAKKCGVGSKVYWNECDSPGRCKFGADCAFHTKFTFYDLDKARKYKAQQAAAAQK
jgi:hypothetical protein